MILASLGRSLALSLFFPHTQGEELRSLPSSNPQPTSPLLSRQRLFPFFPSLLTPPNKCVNSVCMGVCVFGSSEQLVYFVQTTSKQRYGPEESVYSLKS